MTHLPVHVQRMESAFDLVISHEDAWYQGDWRTPSEASSCGTAYCYAGWVTNDAGLQPLTNFDFPYAALLNDAPDTLDYVVIVPPDDAIAPLVAHEAIRLTGMNPVDQGAVDKLKASAPAGSLFVHILSAASALLRANEDDGIVGAVFSGGNDLRRIRYLIDSARRRNGISPRDFAAEPVQYRWDEATPEVVKKEIRERVDWFNEYWVKTGEVKTLG